MGPENGGVFRRGWTESGVGLVSGDGIDKCKYKWEGLVSGERASKWRGGW